MSRRSQRAKSRKSEFPATIAAIVIGAAVIAALIFLWSGAEPDEQIAQEVSLTTKIEVKDIYEAGDFKKALPELIRLSKESPGDTEVRTMLASALWLDGQSEQALEQYREILKLAPSDADTRYRLGILLRQKNQLAEAVIELEKAVEVRPDSSLFLSELAKAYAKRGRYQEAIDNWRRVLEIETDGSVAEVAVYVEMGDTYVLMEKTPDASRAYTAGLAISPDHDYLRSQLEKL